MIPGNNDRAFTIYRPRDGEWFTFDGALVENHVKAQQVSAHPLERGGSVVDHVQRQPDRIAVRAMITESPFRVTGAEKTGPERIAAALRFLEDSAGDVLTLGLTRVGNVADALLVAWPHEYDNKRRVVFDLVFQIAQFATAGSVRIPAAKPPPAVSVSSASEVDAGVQGCFGVRLDVDSDERASAQADLDRVVADVPR